MGRPRTSEAELASARAEHAALLPTVLAYRRKSEKNKIPAAQLAGMRKRLRS